MSRSSGYKKIGNPDIATPIELLHDLRKRSGHYTQHARKTATKNIRTDRRLTITSFCISLAVATTLLLFQSGKMDDRVVWFTIIGSALVSLISILQRFAFDPFVSTRTLHISQQFFEIKEEVKTIMTLKNVYNISDKELMIRYEKINERYKAKRESYIEYVESHGSYYGFSTGPGVLNKNSIVEVLDLPDEDFFE